MINLYHSVAGKAGHRGQSNGHVMQVEADKYVKGVKWLKELLYNIQFTKERLSVVANKMINDVSRSLPNIF